jgi:S1-C subfamily serine protease
MSKPDTKLLLRGVSLAVISAFLLISCRTVEHTFVEITDDSLYRSHTQSSYLTDQIRDSFQSVKRIQSTVFYTTYLFDYENPPLRSEIEGTNFRQIAVDVARDNHSSAGTAVVLAKSVDRVALLTAAHVVSFQDTIWHYSQEYEDQRNRPVEAVSIKDNILNYIYGAEEVGAFELIVSDEFRDLALLSTRLGVDSQTDLVPLPVQAGDSEQLEWADQVYALGYPKGYRMITTGIISETESQRRQGFNIDASFNRGFSGGVVFAIRNDRTAFEWVGMMISAAADIEYLLSPGYVSYDEYDPELEYVGSIYIQRIPRINYGITNAIGINEIKQFFRENQDIIRRRGFPIRLFPR